MKKIALFLAAVSSSVGAQLDRAGNVIGNESDMGGSGEGMLAVLGGRVVGAAVGAIYGFYKNHGNQEKLSINGCMVLGGMAGMFATPLLAILVK